MVLGILWIFGNPAIAIAPNSEEVNFWETIEGNSVGSLNIPINIKVSSYAYLDAIQAAENEGLNSDWFTKVLNCECNWNLDAKECVGDHGKANNRAQFHETTFNEYCTGDYNNELDQINCAAKLMSNGKSNLWSCTNKIN